MGKNYFLPKYFSDHVIIIFFRTLWVGWVGFEKCGKFRTFFLKPSLIYWSCHIEVYYLFHKEASYFDLAAPSEIGIKACTPFFEWWKYAQFLVCEENYIPSSNDVKKIYSLSLGIGILASFISKTTLKKKRVEIPMCK